METLGNLWQRLRVQPESEAEQAEREARKQAVIEKLAQAIVARRLEAPAVLFLELNRPLGFLLSQTAYFARPFLGMLLAPSEIDGAAEVFDDPRAVEALLDRVQELRAGGTADTDTGAGA